MRRDAVDEGDKGTRERETEREKWKSENRLGIRDVSLLSISKTYKNKLIYI